MAVESFVTKDGSTVRELAHPRGSAARNQSLAEAVVKPGATTELHLHRSSEEIYHFTAGRGTMRLEQEQLDVSAGSTVVIAPGTPHQLHNPGSEALVLLCCCSPPYSDEDTVLIDD